MNKIIKTILIIVGILVAIASISVYAQPCSVVRGSIRDLQTGIALPGANIRAKSNTSTGTSADYQGNFELQVTKGDSLLVTFIGYENQHVIVTDCNLMIFLQPSVKRIDEVVIKAEKIIAEEFTVHKIKKLDIYTNPSAKADPILAVNSMAAATTTDESANISLRGGSPDETGVFLNNVPIHDAVRYSQLSGIGTFSIFNTALVNHVQVYPGNPPLEYGNSTSGLIALQTDESIPERNTSTLSVTLASGGFYTNQKLNNKSSLTVFSNSQTSALFTRMNRRSLNSIKGFSSIDLGLHYFNKLSGNTIVKVFNYSLRESYRYRHKQPTYDGIFQQQKIRNFTVTNVRKKIKHLDISLNQGLSFSKASYDYSTMDIALKFRDYFSSINIHGHGNHTEWKMGISYDYKASDFSGSYPTFDFAYGEEYPVSHARVQNDIHVAEAYAYAKQYLGSRWIVGGGLRKNLIGTGIKNYISWQGNLNYKPLEDINIILSVGEYHKNNLPQQESNAPYLLNSTQYSLDINYNKGSVECSVSGFFKKSYRPAIRTELKGVELFTRYKINNNFRFQLSLTSLDAYETKHGIVVPSPYNIRYFLRGNVEYKIKGTWTLTLVYLFREGSYYHPIVDAALHTDLQVYEPQYAQTPLRLPGYRNIDFSVSKIFLLTERSTAVAFLSVGNLINFKNVRGYSYSFDYLRQSEERFSQRVVYFGFVVNF